MKSIIVIVGPTGVGKTKLSIELAKKYDGYIISGDSMQVYKGMDILTAKVKEAEKEGIPHYMLDIKNVEENFSVMEYQGLVRKAIKEIQDLDKTVIIVGGTGLYLKAALYDYVFEEKESYIEKVTEKYIDFSNEELFEELKKIDYESTLSLHPNNRRRVLRALEIALYGDKTKSQNISEQANKMLYDVKFIGLTLDREVLYDRINKRVDIMVEEGLVEEVTELSKNQNLSTTCKQAIGYKEFIGYLNNEKELNECIEEVKHNSRKYAKRQYTWFNNQFDVKWFDVNLDNFNETVQNVYDYLGE